MNRFFFACIFGLAGIFIAGCAGGGWMQNQKSAVNDPVNDVRADVPACQACPAGAAKAPDELCCLLAQADTLVAQNKPADALALLQSRKAMFEHSGVIWDAIGQLQVQQKQYADAISTLREASVLAGDEPAIHEHLAFALLDDHQYVEADEQLARLIKEPGYENRADIFAALGNCQSQLNQTGLARQNYVRATELNPLQSGYWVGLGRVAIQESDLSSAESAVSKALAIDPTSGDAHCLLGLIKLDESKLPESLTAFHAAAELDPGDSVCVSLQGYVLARMGRLAESQAFYARALKMNPADRFAKQFMATADSRD